jgi:hypothetical protein
MHTLVKAGARRIPVLSVSGSGPWRARTSAAREAARHPMTGKAPFHRCRQRHRIETFSQLSRKGVSELTPDQFAALTPDEIGTLGKGKIRQLSGDQIAAIDPAALAVLGKVRIGILGATQIDALTGAQIDGLNRREQVALITEAATTGAWANLSASKEAALKNIKPGAVQALSAPTIAGLSVSAFDALFANTTWRLNALDGVSVADLQSLTAGQFGQLNGFYLNELGGATLSQLDPTAFTADQASLFTASTISGLSTAFIDGLSAQALGAIPTTAISGLSVAQLQSLSPAQLADFSISQIQAMSPQQGAVVAAADPLFAQAASLEVNGVLPFSGALTLLQDVAAQGITAANLQQLQLVDARVMTSDDAQTFGVDDAIAVSPSVQQLFHNVVSGLSATTTQAQLNGLIGQWFLGADAPSLQNGASLLPDYQPNSTPLFDSSGGVALADVREGALGDSALLATIAETAQQDPGYIQQLITNNGNGTFAVELPGLFVSTFETVTTQLPGAADGSAAAVATTATGEWAALLEKAAAQEAGSYSALAANSDDQLQLFSGQYYYSWDFNPSIPQSLDLSQMAIAETAFQKGNNLVLQVGNQYEAVTAIDGVNGTISAYDPLAGTTSTFTLGSTLTNDSLFWGVTGRAIPGNGNA